MQLVLVQSRRVILMVTSVKPLPHRLTTVRVRRTATVEISGTADGLTRSAAGLSLLVTVAVTSKTMLMLPTFGDSDVTASDDDVIVPSL